MNDSQRPIYRQLEDSIKQKIWDGVYPVGEKIPSEREMSAAYGITRVTVRRALAALEGEGVLESIQGRGTFVRRQPQGGKKVNLGSGSSSRLSIDIRSGGMTPSKVVLSLKKIPVDRELGVHFGASRYCVELVRLMLIDGTPYAVQIANLPFGLFEDALRQNFRTCSLYEYMESRGHRPREILSELKIETIPPRYTGSLGIPEGKKVFSFRYFGYDGEGVLVEFTRSYNLPEYTAFRFDVKRSLDAWDAGGAAQKG